ncbi:MAG: NAD(P)/FAD-dependent oxidoreductase, partial [Planctomycetes bacterium]|nr:NAD(P)/FAD-dependent oxidoreductase [Planctomycetota bacterium]
CRIRGGGGALIEALVERGRELGVEYRFGNGLARLECEGRTVVRGLLEDGTTVDAAEFVAACHPKLVMDMLSDDALKPMYKERVRGFRDSRGALQLFVRLAAPLESIGAGCLLLRDARGASAADDVSIDVVLVTAPDAIEADGTPRLEAMTYVSDEPFRRWRETRVLKRGAEYEALKSRLAERMIALIETAIPELRDRIVDVYTATPLTDEWYTRNVHGGVFGISHDVEQMGTNRPMPRMRFRNLFFTGHSIMMPGICGTFINAFNTCEWIRGDEGFFERVVG